MARHSANVVLLDFSSRAVKMARSLGRKAGLLSYLDFIVGDVRFLCLKEKCFDLVWNQGVVEHFKGDDRKLVICEMARVAKANAVVIILTANRLGPIYVLWKRVKQLLDTWEFGFESPYLSSELVDKVEKAGLEVVKSGGIKALAPLLLVLPAKIGRPIKEVLERTTSWISVNADPFNLLNRTLGFTLIVIGQKGEQPK